MFVFKKEDVIGKMFRIFFRNDNANDNINCAQATYVQYTVK